MLFLLWYSTTVGEGRLWERLRIYSGKLFIAIKIKSVKIYAIPFIFSTTLLLCKLDTLLLKQKNLPVLDIAGFFFS
jgi:hypothetical protein